MKRGNQKFNGDLTDKELYLIEDALVCYSKLVDEKIDKDIQKLVKKLYSGFYSEI